MRSKYGQTVSYFLPLYQSVSLYIKVSDTTTYSQVSIKWSAIKRLPTLQRQDTKVLTILGNNTEHEKWVSKASSVFAFFSILY